MMPACEIPYGGGGIEVSNGCIRQDAIASQLLAGSLELGGRDWNVDPQRDACVFSFVFLSLFLFIFYKKKGDGLK